MALTKLTANLVRAALVLGARMTAVTDAQKLRERARHMRELARTVTDEQALQAALALAIEYERQAEIMAADSAATVLDADAAN